MSDIPTSLLFAVLLVLIVLSGFFSGSETALMTLNRYRLRNRLESGDRAALRIDQLLQRPDRVLGVILLGNNFVNILASALATVIALRLFGEAGIAVATGLLTLVILIFAELTPKTLAAIRPEVIAFPAAWVLTGKHQHDKYQCCRNTHDLDPQSNPVRTPCSNLALIWA